MERSEGRGAGPGQPEPPAAVRTPVTLPRRAVGRARPRALLVAPPVPSAWPPLPSLLPSHPAARPGMRKIPENEKGGGRGRSCSTRGGHGFRLPALRAEPPRVGGRPRVLAAGPRERAPRIAAATTCLPHVASAREPAGDPGLRSGARGPGLGGGPLFPLIPSLWSTLH